MALLDEVGHGQAVMAEAAGDGDDEPHMRRDQPVQGALVALVLPAHGEPAFLVPRKEGRLHRRAYELPPDPCDIRHPRLRLDETCASDHGPTAPIEIGLADL